MKDKIISIQLLRAVACLLVLQVHLIPNVPLLHRRFTGSIGVDLFFIISGYIIAASIGKLPDEKPALHFLVNRFSRVAPYYWAILLFMTCMIFCFNLPYDKVQIISSFLFLPQLADCILVPGWSLSHELLFYGFVGLCLAMRQNLLRIGFVFLSFTAVCSFLPSSVYFFRFLGASINYTFLLGMGAFVYKDYLVLFFQNKTVMFFCITAFLLIPFFSSDLPSDMNSYFVTTSDYLRDRVFFEGFTMPRFFAWGIPSLLVFLCFVANEPKVKKAPALLVRIGDSSYSLYLIQGIYLTSLWSSPFVRNVWVCALIGIATVVVSIYAVFMENAIGEGTKKLLCRWFALSPSRQRTRANVILIPTNEQAEKPSLLIKNERSTDRKQTKNQLQ